MADSVHAVNSADSKKAFEAIARMIGEKEGVNIILKSLEKKEERDKIIKDDIL